MKLILPLVSVFFLSNAFAAKITPVRFDPEKLQDLRAGGDNGDGGFEKNGFVHGQIKDIFYNQVLRCTLEQYDSGMAHILAVTSIDGQSRVYEYIDLDSEGMYKVLAKGNVQVAEAGDTVTVLDSSGGQITFSGKMKKNGLATVDLKDPALTVSERVSCWREK